MDETGQPGAPTPGEHGNGADPHGDPARSANGWAAEAGWSGAENGVDPNGRQWHQPAEPVVTHGWGDRSAQYVARPLPASPGIPIREIRQPVNGVHLGGAPEAERGWAGGRTVPGEAVYPYEADVAEPADRRSPGPDPAGGPGPDHPGHPLSQPHYDEVDAAGPARHAFGDTERGAGQIGQPPPWRESGQPGQPVPTSGPPASFSAPPAAVSAPPASFSAPPASFPAPFSAPPASFPASFSAPPATESGPPGAMSGPFSAAISGPPAAVSGPPAAVPAPPANPASEYLVPADFERPHYERPVTERTALMPAVPRQPDHVPNHVPVADQGGSPVRGWREAQREAQQDERPAAPAAPADARSADAGAWSPGWAPPWASGGAAVDEQGLRDGESAHRAEPAPAAVQGGDAEAPREREHWSPSNWADQPAQRAPEQPSQAARAAGFQDGYPQVFNGPGYSAGPAVARGVPAANPEAPAYQVGANDFGGPAGPAAPTTPPGPEAPGYLPGPGGLSGAPGAESAGYLPGPGGLSAAPGPTSPGYLPGPGGLAAGGPNADPAGYPAESSGAGHQPGREPSGYPAGPTGAAPAPSVADASGYPSAHGGATIPPGGESSGYPSAHASAGQGGVTHASAGQGGVTHGGAGQGGVTHGGVGHGPAADQPSYSSRPGGTAPSAQAAEPSNYSAGFGGAGLSPGAESPGYPAGPGPVGPAPAPESAEYPTGGRSAAYPPRREALALPTAPTHQDQAYRYPESAPAEAAPRPAESGLDVLPQRVPAEPDVPTVPEPPTAEPPAETPELARIATHLRREDGAAQLHERPDGFDVNAILAAVRGVAGVRDASLRTTPAGAHSLRLDLSDGADPAEVSRQVARLLQERMGLAAAPQNLPGAPAADPAGFGAPPSGAAAATYGSGSPGQSPAEPREAAPAPHADPSTEQPRRRRQAPSHRGRAVVGDQPPASPTETFRSTPAGTPGVNPGTAGTSYSGSQVTTTETAPSRPLNPGSPPGPRVIIDHVQVSTFGLDATVEVRLAAGEHPATGLATGPAVDGYVLRLCAVAAAAAVDELLSASTRVTERGRCFVEHAAVVPFGSCEVATVVVLLVCDGWVEQLAGSALVAGDPRQAVVRATLAAVNRRLEALLT